MKKIMGILNCTPDSFYDGARFQNESQAILYAQEMISQGACIIDVGGESTKPGSSSVDVNEELKRITPIISELKKRNEIQISIDTTKAQVADKAINLGASIVNDVSGLRSDAEMIQVIKQYDVTIIIVHSRGKPENMQHLTQYNDLINDMIIELETAINKAVKAGISENKIWIDPGLGFAKTAEQNWEILKNLHRFKKWNFPLLIGASRKSFIGQLTQQKNPQDRLYGSLAVAFYAALYGADILRVHDVKETAQVLKVNEMLAA